MKTVWIVIKSHDYEGGEVTGVYTTERRARFAAKKKAGCYDWVLVKEVHINKTLNLSVPTIDETDNL